MTKAPIIVTYRHKRPSKRPAKPAQAVQVDQRICGGHKARKASATARRRGSRG